MSRSMSIVSITDCEKCGVVFMYSKEAGLVTPADMRLSSYCPDCAGNKERRTRARRRLGLGKFGGLDLAETIFRGIYNKLTWGKRK